MAQLVHLGPQTNIFSSRLEICVERTFTSKKHHLRRRELAPGKYRGVGGGAALGRRRGGAWPPQPWAVLRAEEAAGRVHLVLTSPTSCPGAPAGKLCSRHGAPQSKRLTVPCRPCENGDPDFADGEWGPRACISNQLSGDVGADRLGPQGNVFQAPGAGVN